MIHALVKTMNIRELIDTRAKEVKDPNLLPARAAELLNELSALLGNVNMEIRKRDFEYSLVLKKWLLTSEKASHAKIEAETSPEFLTKREARDTKELLIELTRSLKYYLRSFEEEYNAAKKL